MTNDPSPERLSRVVSKKWVGEASVMSCVNDVCSGKLLRQYRVSPSSEDETLVVLVASSSDPGRVMVSLTRAVVAVVDEDVAVATILQGDTDWVAADPI